VSRRAGGTPWRVAAGLAVFVALAVVLPAARGEVYRYQDRDGHWVYADRPPADGRAQSIAVPVEAASPRMAVELRATAGGPALFAVNQCRCPVEFGLKVHAGTAESTARELVAPQSEALLLKMPVAAAGGTYEYVYVIGDPQAVHAPRRPYRAPFALGDSFKVTQAPPDAVTHVDAANRNAIDIGMPVGTPVHAAREGVVINVARSFFRGGTQIENAHAANFVQVLHDDGTNAVYAHLQLDTVRVRPGQRIARGEYIANSGNTGFSSGPHLHFVVLRNAGLHSESVPVTFEGPAGSAVTPRSGVALTAY